MGFEALFTKPDLALLHDWLRETGELYLDLDRPHSGGPNNSLHFLSDLRALKEIVSREKHSEVGIYIFRMKQYPIQGIVDDALLATALEQIPDRQYFRILSLGDGPLAPCDQIGSGDSHEEMREEFIRLRGRNVRIGQDPFDRRDINFFEHPDDVFVVRLLKNTQPQVSRNRTSHPPFDSDPERYGPYVDFW